MKWRVLLITAAVVAAGALAWVQIGRMHQKPPMAAKPARPPASVRGGSQSSGSGAVDSGMVPASSPPETMPSPASSTPASAPARPPQRASRQPYQAPNPAREEAEAIALNLRSFGQRFGGNPVGTNAEIVKTLNGGNPQGVRYLPQEHLRLNDQGELLDSYGSPYFFHQISSEEMEIRSAGPDKTLWTPDDITVK